MSFLFGSYENIASFIDYGALGLGFGTLLIFLLRQNKSLLSEVSCLQREVIQVVEKNTYAYSELCAAFDRLSSKVG